MNKICVFALAISLACGLFSTAASGQAVLDKTTLGTSQNDYRDFQNSMVQGKKRYDKGEKKEEVDLKTMQSKSSKDTTFQGNLMDIDLDWGGEKLAKLDRSSEKDRKVPKTTACVSAKD